MRRRLLVVALTALVAGCGADPPPDAYALEPTRTCLADEDVRISRRDIDFVASTAFGGAMNVEFPRRANEVTLSFGQSDEDAAQTEQAYRRFAPKRLRIEDVLKRDKNVVMLWAVAPTDAQSRTIQGCLRA